MEVRINDSACIVQWSHELSRFAYWRFRSARIVSGYFAHVYANASDPAHGA